MFIFGQQQIIRSFFNKKMYISEIHVQFYDKKLTIPLHSSRKNKLIKKERPDRFSKPVRSKYSSKKLLESSKLSKSWL